MRLAAIALIAVALSGCESSQEQSTKLEADAKQHQKLARYGLSITHESSKIRVSATAVVHSSEGTAAVVTLRNVSATTLRDLPIEITVRSAGGGALYTNDTPGLATALVSVPLLPAHGTASWIDDQVQTTGVPASVVAKVGEGEPVTATIPRLSVAGTHLANEATSGPEAEGTVFNHSSVSQRELVVYAVARRAGRAIAAGRAVIPEAAAGTAEHFQLFFIGSPQGGQLEFSAPPTVVG